MFFFYFWPMTILFPILILLNIATIVELSKQINNKMDSRRWKFLRVWLFVCMCVGDFCLLFNEVLSNIPFFYPYTNWNFAFYFGNYLLLSGCLIAVYLVHELASLHKNRESNPRVMYIGFVVLWVPAIILQTIWVIYPTSLMQFFKSGLQAVHMFILSGCYMWFGGSLLRQLIKSRVLSKKTNALRKLSIMLILGGILSLLEIFVNIGLQSSEDANIWVSFILEILSNLLFIVILGPGQMSIPFYKRIRPFWKQENSDLSPNERPNGDSLSDAFATPSTNSSPSMSQKTIEVCIEIKNLESERKDFVYERNGMSMESEEEEEREAIPAQKQEGEEEENGEKLVTIVKRLSKELDSSQTTTNIEIKSDIEDNQTAPLNDAPTESSIEAA